MHAILAPSSAHRWVNCPGSVRAQQQYPDDESESAREGTAAHWVGEQVLTSYKQPGNSLIFASDFIGQAAPNGVIITEEMAEGAQMYVSDVMKVCQEGGYLHDLQIEQSVTIPRVHELNWGTPDCVIFPKRKLIVWDLKFGRLVVEHRGNWQLINYVLGLLEGLNDQEIIVEFRIVQPRAFHVEGPCRSWTVRASDLRGHANKLQAAAEQSQIDNPPTKAGEWCKYCTASRDCMTLQRATADITDRIEVLQLIDMTPDNTAVEIRYLRKSQVLLNERLEALEDQSLEQVKGGTVMPGFSIGFGRGSAKWTKPVAEVIAMGDLMGIELRKSQDAITPIQAMKLNVDEAVINSYSKKYLGTAKLVTDENTIAGRVFSNNQPLEG